MFTKFEGKLVHQDANLIYLENDNSLMQICIQDTEKLILDNEYKFFVFTYLCIGNKSIEKHINFGFRDLNDAINFEQLLNVDGVGIKTALKIIKNGYKQLHELIDDHNEYELTKKYSITSTIAKSLISFFNKSILEKYTTKELKQINEAIDSLQKLGYTKQISTKVVWKKKDTLIKEGFNNIFQSLIEDIKNERVNSPS